MPYCEYISSFLYASKNKVLDVSVLFDIQIFKFYLLISMIMFNDIINTWYDMIKILTLFWRDSDR